MTETRISYFINFLACACMLAFWGVVIWIDDNPSRWASIGVSISTGWYLHKVLTRIKAESKGGEGA